MVDIIDHPLRHVMLDAASKAYVDAPVVAPPGWVSPSQMDQLLAEANAAHALRIASVYGDAYHSGVMAGRAAEKLDHQVALNEAYAQGVKDGGRARDWGWALAAVMLTVAIVLMSGVLV